MCLTKHERQHGSLESISHLNNEFWNTKKKFKKKNVYQLKN